MGRIVLNHYPAAKLPTDLRGEIGVSASVKVTIEEEDSVPKPLTGNALREMLTRARGDAAVVTSKEAVARIRALRDEWDD